MQYLASGFFTGSSEGFDKSPAAPGLQSQKPILVGGSVFYRTVSGGAAAAPLLNPGFFPGGGGAVFQSVIAARGIRVSGSLPSESLQSAPQSSLLPLPLLLSPQSMEHASSPVGSPLLSVTGSPLPLTICEEPESPLPLTICEDSSSPLPLIICEDQSSPPSLRSLFVPESTDPAPGVEIRASGSVPPTHRNPLKMHPIKLHRRPGESKKQRQARLDHNIESAWCYMKKKSSLEVLRLAANSIDRAKEQKLTATYSATKIDLSEQDVLAALVEEPGRSDQVMQAFVAKGESGILVKILTSSRHAQCRLKKDELTALGVTQEQVRIMRRRVSSRLRRPGENAALETYRNGLNAIVGAEGVEGR